MKTCSALFAILWSAAALHAADAPAKRSSIIAKSHYHEDKSHTESRLDMNLRELEEKTFDANGTLQMRKHYLVNDQGQPTQGNIYDGRNNLVARSMMKFDQFGRLEEMRTANMQGEVFQQVLYSYDANNKPLQPKVINFDTKAPLVKPATIDLRGATPPPQLQNYQPAGVDMNGAAPASDAQPTGTVQQQGEPIYAPGAAPAGAAPAAEPPKKKSFWKRLFGK